MFSKGEVCILSKMWFHVSNKVTAYLAQGQSLGKAANANTDSLNFAVAGLAAWPVGCVSKVIRDPHLTNYIPITTWILQ